MQQIADWLQRLGLGQYAERFAENDISFAILPDLTDQDLKELGVASLGHRRQLLRAITELKKSEEGTRIPSTTGACALEGSHRRWSRGPLCAPSPGRLGTSRG
jgi:SAM domain (Sterile alpha motif)